jgi:glucokinase
MNLQTPRTRRYSQEFFARPATRNPFPQNWNFAFITAHSAKMNFALGIDLGGSSVKAIAVTPAGDLLAQTNLPFNANEPGDWARLVQRTVQELETNQGARATAIGLSAPGLAARDERSILRMPGRLQGLEGLNWTEFLRMERPVPVLNDAHAALLGEAWLGAARGFANVFMLTLGTGVGGAAIVDGHLLKGALGRAGHLGHISLNLDGPRDICAMPGSLEVMIGNCTIETRTGGKFKTTHDLVSAHERGDTAATQIWLQSVRALGVAVAGLINVLDPEAVIIGGGIARSGTALFDPLEKFVCDSEWNVGAAPVKILPAQLGEFAGACGAAWNALAPGLPRVQPR